MRTMGECDTHRINASVEAQNGGSTAGAQRHGQCGQLTLKVGHPDAASFDLLTYHDHKSLIRPLNLMILDSTKI